VYYGRDVYRAQVVGINGGCLAGARAREADGASARGTQIAHLRGGEMNDVYI